MKKFIAQTDWRNKNVMTTVLHLVYSGYSRDPATSYKATYMFDLSNPAGAGDDPKLLASIMQNTAIVRRQKEQSPG